MSAKVSKMDCSFQNRHVSAAAAPEQVAALTVFEAQPDFAADSGATVSRHKLLQCSALPTASPNLVWHAVHCTS